MRHLKNILVMILLAGFMHAVAANPKVCDIMRAKEICDSLPLENPEGIWIYPEDKVTVLVMRESANTTSSLPAYRITVVRTDDGSVAPGESVGILKATAKSGTYDMELYTLRKNGKPGTSQKCVATLSSNGDDMLLSRQKKKSPKFRITLNPYTLLPKTWRIIRMSSGMAESGKDVPAGMVKIYPSYDGNGSSRRHPRYL